ncbi:CCA tRNA nucleotidyltransferase [Peribacillus alkalitolerans]|uniref:CCA tRNA nucleotidyltransferase n=1 Tax=Peribacillus alkalitolerans TaxID=1550385 RepID=UPI0013D62EB7|nr:CCA tRNA nucleotidyltransferase [Peribacillus alkalitolerans]
MDPLFIKAIPILKTIENAGYEAYFVGGSVRDSLLGRPIHDVDIATSATPDQVKKLFSKTIDVGIMHGTVLVVWQEDSYEITTFRTETGYSDFRRPDQVDFVTSLSKDLQRRDFTVNAIAMNSNGMIIDPFGGQEDLQKKRLRTVGLADERFKEDALRMMRAVRFVGALGFTLDQEALSSMKKNVSLLANISIERKTVEFEKLLDSKYADKGMKLLIEAGIHQQLPGLKNEEEALKAYVEYNQKSFLSLESKWSLLMYLVHNDQPVEVLVQWKLPNKKIKVILHICSHLKQQITWSNKILLETGIDIAIQVEAVRAVLSESPIKNAEDNLMKKWEELPLKNKKDLKVSGNDLMEWSGRSRGIWIKEGLEGIMEAILQGEVDNSLASIKRWWESCNQK